MKGHDEGIENKWVRDSAIFRRCRVFRPGDSALSSALCFHTDPQFPRPTYLVFVPCSLPQPSPARRFVAVSLRLPGTGVQLSFRVLFSSFSLPVPSACPESTVRQLGTQAHLRDSLVSGCALPLTAFHRKPIETSRISPFDRTLARFLFLSVFLSFSLFLSSVYPLSRVRVRIPTLSALLSFSASDADCESPQESCLDSKSSGGEDYCASRHCR